jgi:hypothetical protein
MMQCIITHEHEYEYAVLALVAWPSVAYEGSVTAEGLVWMLHTGIAQVL